MTELEASSSDETPKRKSYFWLWASLLALVLLLLGVVGVWKSNNYTISETIDVFVCSGTLGDEPLVAELNFQKDKDRLSLIAFADGRHWSLIKHRIENGKHIWDLLDPDSKVVGKLEGEWQLSRGTFKGQLIQTGEGKKSEPVSLKKFGQLEHIATSSGLRIGPFGRRFLMETHTLKLPDDSPFLDVFEGSNFGIAEPGPPSWDEVISVIEMLTDTGGIPYERFEGMTQILHVGEHCISYRQGARYEAEEWRPSLNSVYIEHGQAEWLNWSEEVVKDQLAAMRKVYEQLNVERAKRGETTVAIPSELGTGGPDIDFTISFEPAGMRVNFSNDLSGVGKPYEFVIPWAEAKPFLKLNGPVKHFMPRE